MTSNGASCCFPGLKRELEFWSLIIGGRLARLETGRVGSNRTARPMAELVENAVETF